MALNCRGCGAEVQPGQKFCRMCGRPTGDLADDQPATQVIGQTPEGSNAPGYPASGYSAGEYNAPPANQTPAEGQPGAANTAPYYQRDTDPVYPSQPGYYQSTYQGAPMQPGYNQYRAYAPPSKQGSRLGWIVAYIGIGAFCLIVALVLIVANRIARHAPFDHRHYTQSMPAPGEQYMPENGAIVEGDHTTIERALPLDNGADITLQNERGSIQVESWDGPGAKLTITKIGGSAQDRSRVSVFISQEGGDLKLRTGKSTGDIDVLYDLKVPKGLGDVTIKSVSGDIKLNELAGGDLKLDTVSGGIDFKGISGDISAHSISGNITAAVVKAGEDKDLVFETVSGNVDLRLPQDYSADLDAHSVSGPIDIAPNVGISAVKNFPVGSSAKGQIGDGGPSLKINTVSGNISISR